MSSQSTSTYKRKHNKKFILAFDYVAARFESLQVFVKSCSLIERVSTLQLGMVGFMTLYSTVNEPNMRRLVFGINSLFLDKRLCFCS